MQYALLTCGNDYEAVSGLMGPRWSAARVREFMESQGIASYLCHLAEKAAAGGGSPKSTSGTGAASSAGRAGAGEGDCLPGMPVDGVEGQACPGARVASLAMDSPAKSETGKCAALENGDASLASSPGRAGGSTACVDNWWGKGAWRVMSAAYVGVDGGEGGNGGGACGLSAVDAKRRKIQKARMNTATYRNRSKLTGAYLNL